MNKTFSRTSIELMFLLLPSVVFLKENIVLISSVGLTVLKIYFKRCLNVDRRHSLGRCANLYFCFRTERKSSGRRNTRSIEIANSIKQETTASNTLLWKHKRRIITGGFVESNHSNNLQLYNDIVFDLTCSFRQTRINF